MPRPKRGIRKLDEIKEQRRYERANKASEDERVEKRSEAPRSKKRGEERSNAGIIEEN